MLWTLANRADVRCRPLADRHYSRQKVGARQFVPPGACLVLFRQTGTGRAYWVTSFPKAEYVKHAWAGAWICSAFRNEGAGLSSLLILDAVAAARAAFGEPPLLGMVTFIDPAKIRRKRDPGRCFLRAGFVPAGTTKGGLLCLVLRPDHMPPPASALTELEAACESKESPQ